MSWKSEECKKKAGEKAGFKMWTTVNIQVNNTIKLQTEFLLPDKVKTKVVGKREATWKKKKKIQYIRFIIRHQFVNIRL